MVSSRDCPRCGAPIENSSEQQCGYCNTELFVDSLADLGQFDPDVVKKSLAYYAGCIKENPNDAKALGGLGLCYLQMGNSPVAQRQFEQVIEIAPEVASAYYYYVLASINGRRLMTLSLSEARLFEKYLITALQMDDKPQYRLLLAMIKRDYYEVNGMKVPPPGAAELLKDLYLKEIDAEEVRHLQKSVKVSSQEDYFFKGLSIV